LIILSLDPISIVIPIKNRGFILSNLIENLLKLNYSNYEIVIVDDCSTDNTKKILNNYKIKAILLEKSVGSATARNIGIKNAKNNIIALTDSDCIVSRNWLRDLVPFLKKYDMVGGKVIYSDKKEMKLYPLNLDTQKIIKKESPVNFLNTSNMIFKKDLWKETGGFLNYRIEDVEFSWRLLKKGFKLIYIPRGTVYHYNKRNTIQNIKKYMQYGKSYSKIAYIHKMSQYFQPEPLFSRNSIWYYVQFMIFPFILIFSLLFCNIFFFNSILYYSILTLLICSNIYINYRFIKKVDIISKLYKLSILFSIVIHSLILALKDGDSSRKIK